MEKNAAEFVEWALHPDRTVEERFGIEILLERAEPHCLRKEGLPPVFNYEADRIRHKARNLDPAYQPVLKRARVERAAGIFETITNLSVGDYQDRPIRDVSFLRFCPSLTNFNCSQTEITDWTPLAHLPSLKTLLISDTKVRDLRPLSSVPLLETLHLYLHTPWPDLRGIENLTELTTLQYRGNILALQTVPRLPTLRHALFNNSHNQVPLRHIHDLPEMPELRTLELEKTDSMEGIARHPLLLNLTIDGTYTDLAPLASLTDLTHLSIGGEDFTDIIPASRIPALRRIVIRAPFPPDLTPLADSPRLHEILLENTPVIPAELASLNSLATPWDEEFTAAEKRPLAPLRLLIRKPHEPGEKRLPPSLPPGVLPRENDNTEMGKSETRWFSRTLHRNLRHRLGKVWGGTGTLGSHVSAPGCFAGLSITKPDHIDRLPAIVDAVRKTIATSRHRWTVFLTVDSLAEYERDIEEITRKDPDEFDAESQREEWESYVRRKKEREEFLRRKYLHQLSLETNNPSPSPPPGETPAAPAKEKEKEQEISYDKNQDLTFDLGTKLTLHATISETAFYVHDQDRDLAETLLEITADPGLWPDEAF